MEESKYGTPDSFIMSSDEDEDSGLIPSSQIDNFYQNIRIHQEPPKNQDLERVSSELRKRSRSASPFKTHLIAVAQKISPTTPFIQTSKNATQTFSTKINPLFPYGFISLLHLLYLLITLSGAWVLRNELYLQSEAIERMEIEIRELGEISRRNWNSLRNDIEQIKNYKIERIGENLDHLNGGGVVEKQERVRKFLAKMRLDNPRQSRETFLRIITGVNGALAKVEPRPAGIVFLVPNNMENKNFPYCFVKKIGEGLSEILSETGVSPKELSPWTLLNFSNEVSRFHTELKEYLTILGGRVVITRDIDHIQSSQLLSIFHSFTDNSAPVSTSAIFLFIIKLPSEVEVTNTGLYSVTHSILTRAWDGVLTRDKSSALIARIATHNVLLRDGDNC